MIQANQRGRALMDLILRASQQNELAVKSRDGLKGTRTLHE